MTMSIQWLVIESQLRKIICVKDIVDTVIGLAYELEVQNVFNKIFFVFAGDMVYLM